MRGTKINTGQYLLGEWACSGMNILGMWAPTRLYPIHYESIAGRTVTRECPSHSAHMICHFPHSVFHFKGDIQMNGQVQSDTAPP